MKRKTNLFYTSGEDSKFLTFSNYTEALTGNFLSTNIKLFPNSFLCLNIPFENDGNKETFIKNVLVSHYENKLAVLRDGNFTNIDELAILINCIKKVYTDAEIVFKGDITEQDYNGTFTDIICTIDSSKMLGFNYEYEEGGNIVFTDVTPDKLHGWYNDNVFTGPASYENVPVIYDNNDDKSYVADESISFIADVDNRIPEIKFNIIIPLFNVVNSVTGNVLKNNSPLGIWFADREIVLTTDGVYGQTWSLAIGTQFKPIPTMQNNYSDIYYDNDNLISYNTFAQILARQNALLESYNKLLVMINGIDSTVKSLRLQVENIEKTLENK